MKRILLTAMMAVVLTAIGAKKAEATVSLFVRVCQGGAVCQNFGPSPGPGPFDVTALHVGDFLISGSVSSLENAGLANGATTTISIQRTTTALAGDLQIWLLAVDYSQPAGTGYVFSETAGATSSAAPGATTMTYQGWFSNADVSGFPPLGSITPGSTSCALAAGTDACSALTKSIGVPGGIPFSMASLTTFSIPNASATATYTTNAQVNVTPVPEPASMLLLGTGLLGVAAFARRRSAR